MCVCVCVCARARECVYKTSFSFASVAVVVGFFVHAKQVCTVNAMFALNLAVSRFIFMFPKILLLLLLRS